MRTRQWGAIIFLAILVSGCSLKEIEAKLASWMGGEDQEQDQVGVEETSPPVEEKKVLAELVDEDFKVGKNWVVVRGTIKNTGEEVVLVEEVSGAAYDQEGEVVGAAGGLAFPGVVFPGQEALVAVFIDETGRSQGEIKDAKIRFSFDKTTVRMTVLKVINFTGKPGENFPYIITGEVENRFPQKVDGVKVILLLYDTEDNLMNVVEVPLEPDFILPGETAPFRKVCTAKDVWILESEKFRPAAYTTTLIAPDSPGGPVIRVQE